MSLKLIPDIKGDKIVAPVRAVPLQDYFSIRIMDISDSKFEFTDPLGECKP